ncbi:hypothetical protein V8C40DRAFT_245781 [Trichoderma camerunense]
MLDAVSTVLIDGMYMLSTLLAPVPCCSVRSYQLLLICCSTSLVLLLHFRPRPDAVSTRSPVITRGPPARFAYLGKLVHRRGAIRRHDSWLASYGNTSSYSRAVSQPVSILVRSNLETDYEAQYRSRLLISIFVLLPISFTTSCKSANPCDLFSICSLPCSLWGIMEGPKLMGLVL